MNNQSISQNQSCLLTFQKCFLLYHHLQNNHSHNKNKKKNCVLYYIPFDLIYHIAVAYV
jgi:hypothetical protein